MKRALFVILFLLVSATLVACGQEAGATGGWDQQVKIPASESHPQVLQAAEQMWHPTATAAAATATASAWATMIAPPEPTPTLVPAPITHVVVEGETFIHVMGKVAGQIGSNCTPQETQKINGITDPNLIYIGQVITFPSDCRLRDGSQ